MQHSEEQSEEGDARYGLGHVLIEQESKRIGVDHFYWYGSKDTLLCTRHVMYTGNGDGPGS